MAATMTIGTNIVTMIEDTIDITVTLDERQRLQGDIIDYTGLLHFQKGETVVITDPTLGVVYNGVLNKDEEFPVFPTGAIRHTLDCIDYGQWKASVRTYTRDYTAPYPAGKLVVDQLNDVLLAEGLSQNFAIHTDSLANDFNTGNLSGCAGYQTIDNQDLELQKAGTDLIIDETTTAQFATGTLTNMQASGNTLSPTTVMALRMETVLSFAYGIEFAQQQQTATGTASGTASGSFSASVSSSGSFSTGVNSSGSFSTNVNSSGSYTPSGSVFISGEASGESLSASFSGSGGSINVSGTCSSGVNSFGTASDTVNSSGTASGTVNSPFSTNVSSLVSIPYQPKTKGRVRVDDVYKDVLAVDKAVADNRVDALIWTGSYTVPSNDVLNYDIWISSSSPSEEGGVDLYFSDGTTMTEYLGLADSNYNVGLFDQHSVSISPIQDLSSYAKDSWYTRSISLSVLSGKTVIGVSVFSASNVAGVFNLYVKNCYLNSHSGTPFFGLTQTTPSLNPPTISSIGSYITAATLIVPVSVYVPATSFRISPAYNIDPVKLIKSSLITWTASNPITGPSIVAGDPGPATTASSEVVLVSYDGTTWLPCTNNQPLPGLPAGANSAGASLYILEAFAGGQDPSAIPALLELTIALTSAPSATTTDIVAYYGNTTEWNTGTKVGTAPNTSGDLTLGITTKSWSNLNGLTFVSGDLLDGDVVSPTISTSGGALVISSTGDSDGDTWSSTRFNFISAAQDFTMEADFTMNASSPLQNEIGFLYRQTFWGSPNNSFGYYVRLLQNPGGSAGGTSISLGYGINSPPTSTTTVGGTFTVLQQTSKTINNNTTYHVKVVVSGQRHTVYFNNETTPSIDILDSTYTQPGNIGVRTYVYMGNTNNSTNKIANFSITNTFAGIWTTASIPLSSLGTCGNTQISWAEVNTNGVEQSTATVISSLDGGNTWSQCSNGALSPLSPIPGLIPGTNVSGKSLLVEVILSTTGSLLATPIIMGLMIRVCGQYPGSSGTRTTAPLAIDTMQRANQSGAGTSFDGQTYTKVGTGTDAISSNELTISNTTGDVHEVLGSRTWTDEDATVRFQLSNSTTSGGIELRYTDANNFYRLATTTSILSVVKVQTGGIAHLKNVSVALSTGVWYRMRYRIVGSLEGSVTHYGEVWPDGSLEPILVNSSNWSILAYE